MKIAKIVPCYPYTHARAKRAAANSPSSYEMWEELIDKLIQGERQSDPGIELDLLLYLREEPNQPQITTQALEKLNSYANCELPRGTVTIYRMPNDHTMGFSAIKEFLEKHSEEYDYLIFQEDDIYLLDNVDGYAKEAVDLTKNVVQLATYCERNPGEKHIAGCYALIKIQPLLDNIETFPLIRQSNELQTNEWVLKSSGAWDIPPSNLVRFKNYPRNFNNATGFLQGYVRAGWSSGEKFLFNVGIETT
tara:strand:- start:1649 stop:2395 length:747 start_codon:yes stop_codon:yes gene_type:complete